MAKNTIDLQQIVENKPLTQQRLRLVHLPTPDEQFEEVRNTPGVSPADLDFAAQWRDQMNKEREEFGKDFAKQRRGRIGDTAKGLKADMYADREAMLALSEQADKGNVTSAEDLLRDAKAYRDQLNSYERAIEAIEESERLLAEVEADPSGHFYAFYGTYAPLAERLPTLAQALNERHQPDYPIAGTRLT